MMRLLKWLAGLIVLGCLAYLALAAFWGVPGVTKTELASDEATIDKGKYLVTVGNCAGCHTAKDGAAFAGGFPVATPFGTIYSTNLTASDAGIKGMDTGEFYQLLAYGADSMWHPLYPAMPYTSYHLVTREDSDAMMAYLMSLPPADQAPPANALGFPYSLRIAMFGWNLLFAERGAFAPVEGKSELWSRGAYLGEGLGHCGECHSPRGRLGEVKNDKALQGAIVGAFEAPDITPAGLVARGWTQADLVTYFATGTAPQGSAFSDMQDVVYHSLSTLTADDQQALAAWLMDSNDPAPAAPPAAAAPVAVPTILTTSSPASTLYKASCAQCHGPTGLGKAGAVPSLAGNATLAQADGQNLIRVIADGLAAQEPVPGTGNPAFGPMPAYRDRMSAAELTDLANLLRQAFGPDLPDLSESQVSEILVSTQP